MSAGKGRRGEGRRGEAGQNGRLSGCPDAPLWAPLGPLDGRLGPPARPSDPSTGRGGKMRETTSPGIATRGFPKQFTDHLKTSLGVVSAGVTKAATVHAKQAIAPSSTEDAVNASTEALQKQTETLQTHYDDAKKGVVKDIKSFCAQRQPDLATEAGVGGATGRGGERVGKSENSKIPDSRNPRFWSPRIFETLSFFKIREKSEKNPRKIREPGGGEKRGEGRHKGWAAAGWA